MINQDNPFQFTSSNDTLDRLSSLLMVAIDKLYALCLSGGCGIDSAEKIAKSYLTRASRPFDGLDKLIKQEAKKAALGGVLTGLGGFITLPIALPTNITSALFIQMRLVATIAILRGHDVNDERVKIWVYLSLCSMASKHKLQHICVDLMMKQSPVILKQLSKNITNHLISILCTKHGIKFIRIMPLFGGLVCGGVDGFITYQVGQFAKRQFH